MKKNIVYVHKPTSKEYLIALIYNPEYYLLLDPDKKPYQPLWTWLKENQHHLRNEDQPLLSIGNLAKACNVPVAKVPRYLKAMYDDILTLNDKEPKKFIKEGQTQCFVNFTYLGCFAYFTIGLSVIPREGDNFNFDFIKPKCGSNHFYVKKIWHEIENNEHVISISLHSEYPNNYMKLLVEKAYLNHEISFMEFITEPNEELKEKLLKRNRHL